LFDIRYSLFQYFYFDIGGLLNAGTIPQLKCRIFEYINIRDIINY
jgi:hypothetical protein